MLFLMGSNSGEPSPALAPPSVALEARPKMRCERARSDASHAADSGDSKEAAEAVATPPTSGEENGRADAMVGTANPP